MTSRHQRSRVGRVFAAVRTARAVAWPVVRLVWPAAATAFLWLAPIATRAAPPPTILAEDIGPQPLAQALRVFARQTHLQIIYVSPLVAGRDSSGAHAGLSITDALRQLLDGTGLRFEFLNARTIRLVGVALPATGPPYYAAPTASGATHRAPPRSPAEVIVTANRSEELASQVPMSVTAWTQQMLVDARVKDLADLAAVTPGLEYDFYPDLGPGTKTNIAVRGVNSRDGTSTGLFIDDVPIPSDPGTTFGKTFPLLFDLDRVEVLRGPQGTLLGESAEGGAIRFLTAPPSLTDASGLSRAEVSITEHGGPTVELGAAGGGPLVSDRVGIRASAWYRATGGYIDRVDPFNKALVDENVNRRIDESARLAVTFAASPAVQVTPALIYQDSRTHDSPTFYPALSDLAHGIIRSGKLLRQPVDDEFELATVRISVALRAADLTSVTAYLSRSASELGDDTNNGVNWGSPLGPEYPTSTADTLAGLGQLTQTMLMQELRLNSQPADGRVAWLAGIQYRRSTNWDRSYLYPHVNNAGVQVGNYFAFYDGDETQLAAFGDVSLRVTERLSLSAGARQGEARYGAYQGGAVGPPAIVVQSGVASSGRESPTAGHLGLSYQADDGTLLYATGATGYRLGGVNGPVQSWCTLQPPASYAPDSVVNLEAGAKTRMLYGNLQVDAAVFRMRWNRMQNVMDIAGCNSEYLQNVGTAVSAGFDLGLRARVGRNLDASLDASYADASYTETVLSESHVRVSSGDAIGSLPLVPSPWNITASLNAHVDLAHGPTAYLRLADAFHSHNPGPFYSQNPASLVYDPTRRSDPSTNVVNIRIGVISPTLSVALFVDNLFDPQPLIQTRNAFVGSTFFYGGTLRPRTTGLNVEYRFR